MVKQIIKNIFDLLKKYLKQIFSSFKNRPKIINGFVEPKDVVPGDRMLVTIEIEDKYGIKEVIADMGGIETFRVELKEGTAQKGVWQAEWLVHDTKTKGYVTIITATNVRGYSSQKEIKWTDSANMILLWDGGAAPDGWTIISDDVGEAFYNVYPYGSDTYGTSGGVASHNHTATVASVATTSNRLHQTATTTVANRNHNMSISSYGIAVASNDPLYRSLKFIKYTGIPTTIPAGAIAIFDTTSLPAGWTAYSAQDTYIVKGAGSVATGGANSHTHALTASLTTPSATYTTSSIGASSNVATSTHTHSASGTSSSGDNTVPYVDVVLAKADSDTPLPVGMIAMFDATPTVSWDVLSGLGGDFYQKFIRGNSVAYGGTGGAATHTHANCSITSNATTNLNYPINGTSSGASSGTHTHSVTFNSWSTDSHLPVYLSVIYAKLTVIVDPPVVTNSTGASLITVNSARLNGEVTDDGGESPTVHIYWGDNDGVTTPGNWDHDVNLGITALGTFFTDISGLNFETIYYYRCYAENSGGSDWADSTAQFTTLIRKIQGISSIQGIDTIQF